MLALATLLACVGLGARMLWTQFAGARIYGRSLEARGIPIPRKLARAAEDVNLARVACVTAEVPIAATMGIIRPRIIVTDALVELLTDEELAAVLVHEEAHLRRRHPAVYGMARAAASAAFVLPVIRFLAREVVLQAEVEADAAAVERVGRPSLVRALAKLLDLPQVDNHLAIGSIRGMIHDRVRALAGERVDNPLPQRLLGASILGLTLLAAPALVLAYAYLRSLGVAP